MDGGTDRAGPGSPEEAGPLREGPQATGLHVPDTDWAGCPKTRKSTSGGGLLLGKHLIKSGSSTQSSVSLSSGRSEFYSVVKASGVALGYQSLLQDLGHTLPVRVWTDSTATIGVCGRQGLGKLRHIDTQCLWIQQRVRDRTVELRKVRGEENPADLFTKHLVSREKIHGLLSLFGLEYRDGRAAAAPSLRAGAGTSKGELLAITPRGETTIERDGYSFDVATWEEEEVPEAYTCCPGMLPHEHADLEARFPRAEAGPDAGDSEPDDCSTLEARGRRIGAQSDESREAGRRSQPALSFVQYL